MRRKISTMQVRQKLGEMLNCVALRHDQYIIERNGKPLAAVIPLEQLEQIEAAARLQVLSILERTKADITVEQADKLANETKHESRPAKPRRRR